MAMEKYILISLISLTLFSCGNSPEEQMLYDYQQKNVGALNFDLDDLEFKIISIEKVGDVTASDSMKFFKKELAEIWETDPQQSLIDTLSFHHVIEALNSGIRSYERLTELNQELVLSAIRLDDYIGRIKYASARDEAIRDATGFKITLSKVEALEEYYNRLAINPDSVLSVKYRANYALRNPVLGNARQIFDTVFFTNQSQTRFIKEEAVE
jgi:hypothetical protein